MMCFMLSITENTRKKYYTQNNNIWKLYFCATVLLCVLNNIR